MSELRYCPKCQRNVDVSPWDTTSVIILIVLLILGILFGLIYLLYKLAKSKRCPVCGTLEMDLESPRFDKFDRATVFCTNCGKEMPAGSKFCPRCGFAKN